MPPVLDALAAPLAPDLAAPLDLDTPRAGSAVPAVAPASRDAVSALASDLAMDPAAVKPVRRFRMSSVEQ